MKINAPTKMVFYISAILAIVGIIFFFVPAVKAYAFFVLLAGFVLLFLGNTLKGF
jgi:hypothetical protein